MLHCVVFVYIFFVRIDQRTLAPLRRTTRCSEEIVIAIGYEAHDEAYILRTKCNIECWFMWCIQYSAGLLSLVCDVGNRQNFVGL